MTYCVAVTVNAGLVFASDSRTNAGVDQVATYGKLHVFGRDGDRQIVLLTAGNLATTQAVTARLNDDMRRQRKRNLMSAEDMAEVADYIGLVINDERERHGVAMAAAGFSSEATIIVGGQIRGTSPTLYLVYPQGNFITTSEQTPYLQIGETKYGKPILDRIIKAETTLEQAGRCALVSIDSTMRSNATVGPPIELLAYQTDSLVLDRYRVLPEDDPFLLEIRRAWNARITSAFEGLPRVDWEPLPKRSRFVFDKKTGGGER